MAKDNRDLVQILKAELEFLETGGYTPAPKVRWRPQFVFEDSPTCLNYGRKETLIPCRECALSQFVPPDCREEKIPCRHIPLNKEGYTVDTYYRIGTLEELEAALGNWLRETIRRLEQERRESVQHRQPPGRRVAAGQ